MGKIATGVERNLLIIVPVLIFVIVLIPANNVLLQRIFVHGSVNSCLSNTSDNTVAAKFPPSVGIGAITTKDAGTIGLSDGSVVFDTSGPGGDDKQRAANAYRRDDNAALFYWQQAIKKDPGDAEAGIYQEDSSLLISGSPFVTLVVGTELTGDLFQGGRDILQGAYVMQKEYNQHPQRLCGKRLRLLIANSGSARQYATTVADQIVRAAKADPTIVGVMGWSTSEQSLNALRELTAARIPMVSPAASSDLFLNIVSHTSSPYFFRIVPFDKEQARYGAQYVENTLHARSVALFEDPNDIYSKSLADDFSSYFITNGHNSVTIENYARGQSSLLQQLKDALAHQPDFIYFSGYWSDASRLLIGLSQITSQPAYKRYAQLPVIGGDALYELARYPEDGRPGFSRLSFTAFASPDEWQFLCQHGQKKACSPPSFFSEYAQTFDPDNQYPPRTYGFNFPDADAILAADATHALLAAYSAASSLVASPAPDDVQQALLRMNGNQAIQGISGRIAFGPDGNPENKPVTVLAVNSRTASVQLVLVQVGEQFMI